MKAKRLILLFIITFVLAGCSLPFSGGKAGIQVTTNPQANVFLDNKSLGSSPVVQTDIKAGSYTVRVTSNDTTLVPWEGKVTLNSGIQTVVDRQLSAQADKASGYTSYMERLTSKTSPEVSLIGFPDKVAVAVDGAPLGFTPIKSDAIGAGAHTFTFTSAGYQDKVISAKVVSGYRLVINVQLGTQTIIPAPTPQATPSATPALSPTPAINITPLPKQSTSSALLAPYVLISTTPTGWLKVRAEANPSASEIAKVNPGDKFPYLDVSGSWYQIEYLTGKKGWVSSQYSTLVK